MDAAARAGPAMALLNAHLILWVCIVGSLRPTAEVVALLRLRRLEPDRLTTEDDALVAHSAEAWLSIHAVPTIATHSLIPARFI